MEDVSLDPWLSYACEEVERSMLDGLASRATRYMQMREAIARGRDGALHYVNDNLVGFVTGLMTPLWLLGVKPELLKLGEYPYESWFFREKRWDYLLEDPENRPVARIEMKCMSVCPRSDIARLQADMPAILGTLYDHRVSCPKCFTGLVIVCRLRTPPEKPRNPRRWLDKIAYRRDTASLFIERARRAGLVDHVLYLEECDGVLARPLEGCTTASFLSALRAEIVSRPEMLRRRRYCRDGLRVAGCGY